MKPYSGYLFDLDGTLIDTAPDINVALNHALAHRDRPPVNEALTRHWVGHGARVLVEQALAYHELPGDDLDPIHEAFLAYYADHSAEHSRVYPGVVQTLEALKARGARLAVLTNKLTRFSLPILSTLGVDGYFDATVCGDTATAPKPAADPALLACRELRTIPGDSLVVGDSQTDVLCARAAGCPVVCVRDGYNHGVPADQLGADAVIESFLDLL
ncbi:MAG: phosphoglycolate phosphatase [Pseudomonadales bacterium]|nr:phosphoglycolate phosphatase [Pseudomonadales bacterium]NIX09735.1 phosphoglycolate phosphatase [Pseudomonadales bacterium]